MVFKARAAAIIFNDKDELLLVLHRHPKSGEEWWTLPGGGLEIEEDAKSAVAREVLEECGIECSVGKLVYVKELIDEENLRHYIEMFFTAVAKSFDICTGYDPELTEQYIIETRFMSRKDIRNTSINVIPQILRDRFWDDRDAGFRGHISYLGQHRFLKA